MTQHVIALMVLSIGLSGSMWSQTLGSIVGEVKDASGAVAPNVKVTAINTTVRFDSTGKPTQGFGAVTAAGIGRVLEFGIKLNF